MDIRFRRGILLSSLLLVCLFVSTACGASSSSIQGTKITPTATPSPKLTAKIKTATLTPTPKPVPNLAVLGADLKDFTAKFGSPTKDSNPPSSVRYQPYGDIVGTDKIIISLSEGTDNNYHADSVTFSAPPNNPVSWQDGMRFCQSFLPADAIHLQDTDFSTGSFPTNNYQQMYMSKSMAHEFSANMFLEGNGPAAIETPVAPGTVQIFYFFTSPLFSGNRYITLCYVSLGQPY
jgi:hypothetical protein